MKAILTFHSLDDTGSVISFPPLRFRELVESLARSRMPVMDLASLLQPATSAGVSLTFDDGLQSVFTHALPVLRDHGLPAHLFVATDHLGRNNRWPGQPEHAPSLPTMSWDELERCHAGGMRIESHSASHADLRTLDLDAAEADCARADAVVAQRLGRTPRYFAYPYGYFTSALARRLSRHYAACVTTQLRYLNERDDGAALPRLDGYYLVRSWTSPLWTARVRAYVRLRGWLRTLRGTQ
jgi:peptidoglycan/xylan/chitin deacetylase (PgdA/CDA1 family)